MVARKLDETGGELSMRFGGVSEGTIYIDATLQQRQELAQFLQQSIDTKQIDTSNAAGAPEYYAVLKEKILSQTDETKPLLLTPQEFLGLTTLANAWSYGFRMGGDEVEYDVSPDMVENLRQISADYLDRAP